MDAHSQHADNHIAPIATALLGAPIVALAGRPIAVAAWGTRTARDVYLYLVDAPDGAHVDTLAAAFWPDAPSDAIARRALHTALWRARRAVGPGVIVRDGDRFRVAAEVAAATDVTQLGAAVRAAWGSTDAAATVQHLSARLDLVRGEYLDGVQRDWALDRRYVADVLVNEAIMAYAGALAELRQWDEAARQYRRVIGRDKLREDAHRGLMRAHAGQGNRAMAMQQFGDLSRLLVRELDALPDPETLALLRSIRGNDRAHAVA